MRIPKWVGSPLIIIALVIVLIVVASLEFRQWRKREQIQNEIDKLISQQQEIEQKNHDLSDSLDLLNTKDYREKLARQKLGLKREGEIVVNFPVTPENNGQDNTQHQATNPQKWWDYFFQTN
jgi:cell division protein DivIC